MNNTAALYHWSGGLLCSFGLYLSQKHKNILCLINFRGLQQTKPIFDWLPISVLRQLSDSLDIPLFTPTTNSEKVTHDVQSLLSLVNEKYGVNSVVLNGYEPSETMDVLRKHYESSLFQIENFVPFKDPYELCEDALNLGFKAHIFSINEKILNRSYLGAAITVEMLKSFKEKNIHPFGLNDEFDTICTEGPNFKNKISVNFGDVHFKNGYWYREITSNVL